MNRPIRKTAASTNLTGSSRANTSIIGTPKLSGHHSVSKNITNVQQGTTKCIISIIIFLIPTVLFM